MKNLILASAALAVLATPAVAGPYDHYRSDHDRYAYNHVDRDRHSHTRITLGIGIGSLLNPYGYSNYTYGPYPNTEVYGAVVPPAYGYNYNRMYRTRCGAGDVPVIVSGLRSYGGSLYVSPSRMPQYGPLYGERFTPASTVCVDRETAVNGYVSFVHDVNNNGVFDRYDGYGQARITPNYDYNGGYYGATLPARVQIHYGF